MPLARVASVPTPAPSPAYSSLLILAKKLRYKGNANYSEMFISHFEVIDSKSGSVVFQTTLWDALGDTIAFSFAPPLDENHPDGSRTPPPPSISLGTAVIPRRNKKQRLCKMLRGEGGGAVSNQ